MAPSPRRSRRRAPRSTEAPVRSNGGALSPAFHHLLRCLTPTPASTIDEQASWSWHVRVQDNFLRARPVWEREGAAEPMTWSGTAWTPQRDTGWRLDDRADLMGVMGATPAERGEFTIRSAEQMDALIASMDRRTVWLDTKQGAVRCGLGAPLTVVSRWEDHPDGGVTLVQEEGFSPRWVVVAGEQVWKIEQQEEGRSFHQVTEGAEALLWSQRHQHLSVEDLQTWALRFADDERLAKLPAPPTKATVLVDVTPRLVAEIVASGDEGTFHLGMHLRVAYGDTVVSLKGADTESVARDDGTLAIIHRNRSIERRTLNAIAQAGLRVWPHPFSKRDAFPFGWVKEWLADTNRTWVAPEPPPSDLAGWFSLAQRLEGLGVEVRWEAKLPFARAQSEQRWTTHVEPASGKNKSQWLEAGMGVDVDGEKMDLTAALVALLSDPTFPQEKTSDEADSAVWLMEVPRGGNGGKARYLGVPLERLRRLLAPLREAEPQHDARGTRVRLPKGALNEVNAWPTDVQVDTQLQDVWQHLREGFSPIEASSNFQGTLRPYQATGLGWLSFLKSLSWGGILGDDMGLGKTVQVLAHLVREHQNDRLTRPALVVVPASLLHNWQKEAAAYAPSLKLVVLHGNERAAAWAKLGKAQIALTTYDTMRRIEGQLCEQEAFSFAIFDEAQNLKNARSQASLCARKIPATCKLAMTGTPLENHLGELWAQVDLVMPGLLGSRESFRVRFQNPIEKRNDSHALALLRARLGPILLRRLKSEVAQDLPAKTETVLRLDLGEGQRLLYESIRAAQKARVEQAVAEKGLAASSFTVLNALLQMRQACCEPSLLDAGADVESVKREFLLDRLDIMLDEGRRVLVFSSFVEVLEKIGADLKTRGVSFEMLTGDTPTAQRGARVERFQNGEAGVFLISLKAGGVGLNLTAADTVIHYDPWWNPAAENQATDRAHRIGQDKPVFVYRLICNDTLEEHILTMQARKSELAGAVLDGLGKGEAGLTEADLGLLFG